MTSSHGFYHLEDIRPRPLTGSIRAIILNTGLIKWFHQYNIIFFVIKTCCYSPYHISKMTWCYSRRYIPRTLYLCSRKRLTMENNFIYYLRNIILFFLFFHFPELFFHSRLAPTIEIGINWPPYGIQPFNPFEISLLNTTILCLEGLP